MARRRRRLRLAAHDRGDGTWLRQSQRGQIIGETYVPLGTTDFSTVIDQLERSTMDGVLVLLVGEDAIHFHRAFAVHHLDHAAVRLTPLRDENMAGHRSGVDDRAVRGRRLLRNPGHACTTGVTT